MTDVPWLLNGEPRDVQVEALRRAWMQPGYCYFMEMRLGKTATALNEFLALKREGLADRMLVLAPNAYKWGWRAEIDAFGVDLPVHVCESHDRPKTRVFMRRHYAGIVVVNYEGIRDDYVRDFAEWARGAYICADESVSLKNHRSKTFKAALELAKNAAFRRCLTGLPAPQSPADYWAQLRFAGFLDGWDFYPFRNTFCTMGGFKGKQVVGTKNLDRLNALLQDKAFRATRDAWGMRLPTDYEIVELDLTPKQAVAYREMELAFVTWLADETEISVKAAVSKYVKMQQISSGLVYDERGGRHEIVPFALTPKFLHLRRRLEEEVPGKTLIVAHFAHTIAVLAKALHAFEPAVIRAGSDVEEEKRRFNEEESCRVLIGQSQAIKYGHRLMGTRTSPCLSVCFFENSFSLDNRAQAEERPQGAGQRGNLHIWDYAASPLERKIIRTLQKKRDVSNLIMDYRKMREAA